MTKTRTLAIGALALALLSGPVDGQELSRYRTFELGNSVASVLAATGASEAQVKVRHQRPALLQELEWRPSRWTAGTIVPSTDPVDQVSFSFYNDQLFRIAIGYGREHTVGLTNSDVVAAISTMYGSPLPPVRPAARPPSSVEAAGTVIAQWGDANHAIALYRTAAYGDIWRLIVTSSTVDALARRAESQALALDVVEAPQREVDRQKQARERERAAADKARDVNKPAFRP
jgi:hypothetical protein